MEYRMIVLTGDSHVNALRHGAAALESELKLRLNRPLRIGALGNGKHTLKSFSEKTPDGVRLTQRSYATALRLLSGSPMFQADSDVTYGICLGFHSPPVFRHPMWERPAPSRPGLAPGKVPISAATLEAIIQSNNNHIYRLFEALKESNVDFFVISSPPPRRDHYCLANTPEEVVLEVDGAFRSSVQRHLQSLVIRYAMPPPDVYDGQGFLRDDLAQRAPNDFHHGNAEYGRRFIRALFIDNPQMSLITAA
jgi:hypothetical protein